jgi:TonB family protein
MERSTFARCLAGRAVALWFLTGVGGGILGAQEPCAVLETPGIDGPHTSRPWPLTKSLAVYPPGDTRPSRSDSARVEFVVSADSSIERCSISILWITDETLSDVVIDAVAMSRWDPARRDGKAVAGRVRSTQYVFTPDEAASLSATVSPPATTMDSAPAVEPPELLFGEAPEYPRSLLATGRAGRVVAAFTILPDGRVDMRSVRFIESSDALFNTAVRQALATFRYRPPTRPGTTTPTSFNMELPFVFRPPGAGSAAARQRGARGTATK